MKRFPRSVACDLPTPRNAARNGRTLRDWVRLARTSPGAVPVHIRQVIEHRHPVLARELGYL